MILQVLDWSDDTTWAAVYSSGAVVGCVVIQLILYGLYRLRLVLYDRCCPVKEEETSSLELSEDYYLDKLDLVISSY